MTPSTPAPTDGGALADDLLTFVASSRLFEIDSALRDQIADKVIALLAALRNSAPQETRGGEPVAWRWRFKRDGEEGRWIYNDDHPDLPTKEIEIRPLYAAPQQSPRLEREGIEAPVNRASPAPEPCSDLSINELIEWLDAPQYTNGFLDFEAANHMSAAAELLDNLFPEGPAILALLSPDTTVVPSTLRVCVDCGQVPACDEDCPNAPLSSNHPREVGK